MQLEHAIPEDSLEVLRVRLRRKLEAALKVLLEPLVEAEDLVGLLLDLPPVITRDRDCVVALRS